MIQKQETRQAGYVGVHDSPCLHELFETQVALTPDAVALSGRGWRLSYFELNEEANRLAHHLRFLGVGPETVVGLLLPRSREAMIGILGILKSGGAYLPLDPSYPDERLRFLIGDSGAQLVISLTSHVPAELDCSVPLLLLDLETATLARSPAQNLNPAADADNLAYMIYTSGSTGTPKGVQIEHRGVGNLVLGQTYAAFGAQEVYLMLSSLAFDFSTLELWGALLHGARLVVYEPGHLSLSELGRTIREQGVTTLMITPAVLNHLVGECLPDLTGLRHVLTCGDVPSAKTVQALFEGVPGCDFVNLYGPTENTVLTTAFRVTDSEGLGAVIPIGRAIFGTEAYVMTDDGVQAAPGEVGELWLGGLGIARGYANRPELTAAQFVPHPFDPRPGARLYRTGDLGRERPDGNLEFLGRRDYQVKIRGHRIELPEIERVMGEHPDVQEAVVLALPLNASAPVEGQENRLVAFVEAVPQGDVNAETLRGYLAGRLPGYMIPGLFVRLDAFPTGPTGKVNRHALKTWPLPTPAAPGPVAETARPLSAVETQMSELWAEVLGTRPDPEADFFAHGGTSLRAALLLSRVANLFGFELPPSVLFERSSVRALSALIEKLTTGAEATPAADGLVRLTPGKLEGGSREERPLILIGDPYMYRLILPHLPVDQPIYALDRQIEDVTRMAASMVEVLRRSPLRGPYRLCGFSYEGLVAYELARLLRQQGEEVSFLGLVDTSTPDVEEQWHRLSFLNRMQVRLGNFRWLIHPDRRPFMVTKALLWLSRRFRRPTPKEVERNTAFSRRYSLMKDYQPARFDGAVTLFRATAEYFALYDPLLGWGQLSTGGVSVVDVRGGHLDLLITEEGSRRLGSLLSAQLSALSVPVPERQGWTPTE